MAPTLLNTCFAGSAEGARGSYFEHSRHLGLYFLLSQRHTLKAGSSASAGKSGVTQQLPKSLHLGMSSALAGGRWWGLYP